MLCVQVYQAPLQLLLPARQPDGDVKVGCVMWPLNTRLLQLPNPLLCHTNPGLPPSTIHYLHIATTPSLHTTAAWQECSLAHLIGLFRLDPGESLLSLGYRGALADCLLWALMRVQSHIFASATYDRYD